MQTRVGAVGRGRGPNVAPPPPGLSPSTASVSPSSSSSAVSATTHLGFESLQQHQLTLRQQQQLQQLRKSDQENLINYNLGSMHGVAGGSHFSSSSGIPAFNNSRNLSQDFTRQPGWKNLSVPGLDQKQNYIHTQIVMQASQQHQRTLGNPPAQKQGEFGMMGPPVSGQEILAKNLKMQEILPVKSGNLAHSTMDSPDRTTPGEKQNERSHPHSVQKADLKESQTASGLFIPTNTVRSLQLLQSQGSMEHVSSNQLMLSQLQFLQNWAVEHNIDLTLPGNANLIAQFLPILHSNKLSAMHKLNANNTLTTQSSLSVSKPEIVSSPFPMENCAQGNLVNNLYGQHGLIRSQASVPPNPNIQMPQPLPIQMCSTQIKRSEAPAVIFDSSESGVHVLPCSTTSSQKIELLNSRKSSTTDLLQMQSLRQPQHTAGHPTSQPPFSSSEAAGSQTLFLGRSEQAVQQHFGFTKQQLHVLKAQILAFRRLKREHALPPEVLQAITPPLLELQTHVDLPFPQTTKQEVNMEGVHERNPERNILQLTPFSKDNIKEGFVTDEKARGATHLPVEAVEFKEDAGSIGAMKISKIYPVSVKSEQDVDLEGVLKGVNDTGRGSSIPSANASVDGGQLQKLGMANVSLPLNAQRYIGPLFDFSFFNRKSDILGLGSVNNSNNFILSYDINGFLFEEGNKVLRKKRTEHLRKLSNLLSFNLERKIFKSDLVLRLQIEEKKLRLLDIQTRIRGEVGEQQQHILAMPDRPYRKFVRQCERQRLELLRQVQQMQKVSREKQLKAIFVWRKKLLETHWAIRDTRSTRNRGVAKYHERMLREFSKGKDDDRCKRLEALKNNDVNRYREMLLEQQITTPGDTTQRYTVLSSFLSLTEEYLHKLGKKITTSKKQQDAEEAASVAAAAARSQGLSEEEVKAAAACAREEVMIRNTFFEMNAPIERSSDNKYYNLAHTINERVLKQPSMLRAGTLRDYQLIGLQWMLSLYNNNLNGILADEMGLGKTVQVMALIAYLMEFKGNYGPHLIIVPNAVLVNWKSELHNWLPSVSSIFYVGAKEERSRLFSHVVCAKKFNVLVTTYEFVMYDRSKLSKVDWKYIFIDEAQRMKDRESVLARDLDRYRCQRRLLLTGTPLQNDLKELWSLLNLLLPEVFDNQKAFQGWFSKPFQKDGSSHNQVDDWLETEKKVIVIHRLHQILEPFMLRRRVEDVEGSLPPKVSIVLRCRMSALQGVIYDWIKSTGTIRLDPDEELRRAEKNPVYQIKMYKNLNNKCMELRKACNHPLLNYPYFSDYSKDFLVRSCGKLWILDRILLKLQRAGHRVLLFSTMTKLLDILEEYLQWRHLVYRRIDGATCLEDRETAILDFNSPDSDCFIFLLSIRAAGRGLNLQSADTVVIYDPDPNPQNEEQAVARAHRIGQHREVKVIYMEAVGDKFSSYEREDVLWNGINDNSEDDLTGKDRYMGTIESLIRNNIQQYKIDMADEVINAGRFDQRTTHEERRMTLEALLHDEERYQGTVHDVPSLLEVNRMIARSEDEVELFDQMDEELDWTGEMMKHDQVPLWLRTGSMELNTVVASLSKKPSKNILGSVDLESQDILPGFSSHRTERKRRTKGIITQKYSDYVDFDEEDSGNLGASSEGNAYSSQGEDGELDNIEDEDFNGVSDLHGNKKDTLEGDGPVCDGAGSEFSDGIEGRGPGHICEEAGSTGSSSGNRRLQQPIFPSISLHKFGSLSELDYQSGVFPIKKIGLEDGEIAVSSDSHPEIQQSSSWNFDRDDVDDDLAIHPRLKRKRSKRFFSRPIADKLELKSSSYRNFPQHASKPLSHVYRCDDTLSKLDGGIGELNGTNMSRNRGLPSPLKQRNSFPTRRAPVIGIQKSEKCSYVGGCEDPLEHSRESWNGWASNNSDADIIGRKKSDNMQRKYKDVISKLQRRIDKEGCQLVPILHNLWMKNCSLHPSGKLSKTSNPLSLRSIEQRVETLGYSDVTDFIADVQSMLKNVVQFCKYSREVKYEARKLQDMFFIILKSAFPASDFGEAKKALTFPAPGEDRPGTEPNMKLFSAANHTKLPKVEGGPGPPRPPPRTSMLRSDLLSSIDWRGGRTNVSRLVDTEPRNTATSLKQSLLGPLLSHPGDLVVCKKKRKDRDKPSVRLTPGPQSSRAGPSFSARTNQDVKRQSLKDPLRPAQPVAGLLGLGSSILGKLHWPRPLKRLRTNTGRREPFHL